MSMSVSVTEFSEVLPPFPPPTSSSVGVGGVVVGWVVVVVPELLLHPILSSLILWVLWVNVHRGPRAGILLEVDLSVRPESYYYYYYYIWLQFPCSWYCLYDVNCGYIWLQIPGSWYCLYHLNWGYGHMATDPRFVVLSLRCQLGYRHMATDPRFVVLSLRCQLGLHMATDPRFVVLSLRCQLGPNMATVPILVVLCVYNIYRKNLLLELYCS